ncbi:Uncharacterised protein [Zhongshania aliphaticivorans]|uniref:Uncharacterized protein n=1 Tax=Zhongshania aliphaticivorans TaxID=1470434 RepID=A0A5S9N5J2_9GAMM|nr:hypothetical protein [Zhongshania aliphaticivorans]CAA0081953.1 Uncharacterised protein [Zhongshania aliphaticivorans]CAA0084558.1 Uncharacterised protein [Zhongshania aliphaticivorans]
MSEALSLPKALHEKVLNTIVDKFSLTEELSADGEAFLPLFSQLPMHQGSVGYMRKFTGNPLFQVVTSSIVVPALQLDSHMVFAFTPSDSAVPHFTVDSVCAGEHHAFHLDLIPRMDLGSQLTYMNEVFLPLTESWERGSSIEGLSRAHLSPRQLGIMSPWMLANRATESAFEEITAVVDDYLEHWFSLLEKGVSAEALNGVTSEELIARDARNKFAIFNADVDPVWQRIAPLVGEEAASKQIETLRAISG